MAKKQPPQKIAKKIHKQPKKAPETLEFVDTEDETESNEEGSVVATPDREDEKESIKTVMGKNNAVLRKELYMGEKISYVAKIDIDYLKKKC